MRVVQRCSGGTGLTKRRRGTQLAGGQLFWLCGFVERATEQKVHLPRVPELTLLSLCCTAGTA